MRLCMEGGGRGGVTYAVVENISKHFGVFLLTRYLVQYEKHRPIWVNSEKINVLCVNSEKSNAPLFLLRLLLQSIQNQRITSAHNSESSTALSVVTSVGSPRAKYIMYDGGTVKQVLNYAR